MDTKALRQKILDLAIRGKLVPQDPADEPASVLLERIRAEKQQMVKDGKLKAKDIKNDTVIFVGEDNLHYEKFADGTVKCIEDEIPFDLPEGWEWARIYSIVDDLPYGTTKKSENQGKVAVLRMGNIQVGEIDYNDLVYTNDDEDIRKYWLVAGDLLFNRTNSAEWVGKTSIYRGNQPCIFAGYLIRVRTHIIPEYLNIVMNSQHAYDYCMRVKTDGVNQSNINAQKLGAFLVPVPPTSEQIRISSYVSTALPLIRRIQEEKGEIKQLISRTKAKILDLAIRGQLVPQNPDDEPASVLLEQIRIEKDALIKAGKIKRDNRESIIFRDEDNSYYETIGDLTANIDEEIPFDVPDGWAVERLKNIYAVNPKNELDGDTLVSFVPMALVDEQFSGRFTYEEKAWKECRKGFTHFADGDVGFAKISPCFENRKSAIFTDLKNGYGAGTTELFILRSYASTILAEYTIEILKSGYFIDKGIGTFSGVVGQQRVDKNAVFDTIVLIPPHQEQKRIAERVNQLFSVLESIGAALD